MRPVLAAAAFVTLAASSVFAQSVVYSGTLNCEASPSANLRASSVQANVTRQGNTVTFERPIYHQDTLALVGQETGSGTLAGGRFVIETASHFGGSSMRGRYEGTLTDAEVRLTGTREWSRRTGIGTQACRGVFRPRQG